MAIIKNKQITDAYNVSYPTVLKWLEDAKINKNNLILEEFNKKLMVSDTPHNQAELSRLANDSKKFRSNISHKKTTPSDKFYEFFSTDDTIDIFNSLELKKEVKFKYSYRNGGAEIWNQFYLDGGSPVNKATDELIKNSVQDILYVINQGNKINLIDIGPGNGYPIKNILSSLQDKRILNSYIPIDLSKEILVLTVSNIQQWFPAMAIREYQEDLEIARFSRIFLENSSITNGISNLILNLGNTMSNQDDRIQILKNFRGGMTKSDTLVITFSIDTEVGRSAVNYVKTPLADFKQTWLLEEMGIDISKCEINLTYDDSIKAKIKTVKLDKDYTISFDLLGEMRELELLSGQEITVWKHFLVSEMQFQEELKQAGLKMLNLKLDKTLNNALVICKIDI